MSAIIHTKILGDCRRGMRQLPDNYFHLAVTSPPYWCMREYLPTGHPLKHLEIGNERTLDEYLSHIVEVFAEVHRVLRDDGLLWVNIGDRYSSGGRRTYDRNKCSTAGLIANHAAAGVTRPVDPEWVKKKELCLLHAHVAMALQRSGWYVRSLIPWIKPNPMPESAKDRPGVAVEYFILLSKGERYFYDAEAVKVAASDNTHPRSAAASTFPAYRSRDENRRRQTPKASENLPGVKNNSQWSREHTGLTSTRNRRNSDWFTESFRGLLLDDFEDPMALIVNPKGTTIKHFASYPAKLIEPIIKCSTSDGGCCSVCGENYQRIVEDLGPDREHQKACGGDSKGEYDGTATKDFDAVGVQNASDVKRRILNSMRKKKTLGFKQSCECENSKPVPCRVLDPFWGTGTTGQVCTALGRECLGFEISEVYFKDSDIKDSQIGMNML